MTVPINFTFTPGGIIFASQHNSNMTGIKGWGDAHEIATTGVHGVGAGAVMGTTLTQAVIGPKTFSGANTLLIPTAAPSAGAGSIGLVNNQLNIYDGTSPRIFVPVDKSSVIIHNIGWNLNAGAIAISGLFGTALSASNAGWISYPGTSGTWLSQTVTANQSIASGGLKGRWGTTPSVPWGSDMPLAIGVCSSDGSAANIRFFLARNPAMTITPASTNNIGIDGTAPVTSSQDNIVLFGSAANTGYNSRPCRIIGSIRATCDGSAGGVWTITAADGADGIGHFRNFGVTDFTMPLGQHGGGGTAPAAGKALLTNGGTAPVFTTNDLTYTVGMDGFVTYKFNLFGDGGADGVGGAALALLAPPLNIKAASTLYNGSVNLSWGGNSNIGLSYFDLTAGGGTIAFLRNTSATALTTLFLGDLIAGARGIEGSIRYSAFD